jgi:hypothetical protein
MQRCCNFKSYENWHNYSLEEEMELDRTSFHKPKETTMFFIVMDKVNDAVEKRKRKKVWK